MLKQAVSSLALAVVFAGCGLPPDEEDERNAMPTEAEVLEAQAALPSQITSFAAGEQTRRETGIYTWRIHRNGKNLLTSGWNKNGKRIFRNWVWATQPSEKGLSALYMGPAAKLGSFSQAQGHKIHVGSRMSAAKRRLHKQVVDGLTRDFRSQRARLGCVTDSVSCALGTLACVETGNGAACLGAANECAAAFESCGLAEPLEKIGEAIGEAIETMMNNCAADPTICNGT